MAVKRHCRFVERVPQVYFQGVLLADELAILEQRLLGGVDDNDAVVTIEQGMLAGLQLQAGIF